MTRVLWLALVATTGAASDYSPDEIAFARLRAEMGRSGDRAEFIKRVEAFAQQHAANQELAARAHLLVVECLVQAKDFDAAIAKAKWLAESLPRARRIICPQVGSFSYLSLVRYRMREWQEYVRQHPIYIKDYVWFEIAKIQRLAGWEDEALESCERILSSLPPDELPDTRNLGIVRAFRLHKETLDLKIELLYSWVWRRTGSLDAAKQARTLRAVLYPTFAWKWLNDAASRAWMEEVAATLQEKDRRDEASRREWLEAEKATRRRQEAEQRRYREELRASKEEKRQLVGKIMRGDVAPLGEPVEHYWRHAVGGRPFSFQVKLPEGGQIVLLCRYWGCDFGDRDFNILVDGQEIAIECLPRSCANDHFERCYSVPGTLTRGKRNVEVSFQPFAGRKAGGLFDLRVIQAR